MDGGWCTDAARSHHSAGFTKPMKPPPEADGDWVARVTDAGVRLDLWDGQFDDQEVVLLCETTCESAWSRGCQTRISIPCWCASG